MLNIDQLIKVRLKRKGLKDALKSDSDPIYMVLRLIEDLKQANYNSDEEWDWFIDRYIKHLRTMEQHSISAISEEAWRKIINRCIGEILI